ncbi:Recombination-associated protein RdgC [compost metagenome]
MTWADRVSFVLTEGLDIKRVAPLDVLKEGNEATHSDDEKFDSDMALMTGELAKMMAELVDALGGEKRI